MYIHMFLEYWRLSVHFVETGYSSSTLKSIPTNQTYLFSTLARPQNFSKMNNVLPILPQYQQTLKPPTHVHTRIV